MGMALYKQGKDAEALPALEKFLNNPNSSKAGEDKVAEAKAALEELKGKQGGELVLATTPAGATVTIDGEPQPGETPMTVKLKPGTHKVTLTSPGYETKEMEVNVIAGQKTDQNVELTLAEGGTEPVPAPIPVDPEPAPTEPTPPAEPRSKVPAYVTLGIAGASAVVGTFFGIKALGAKSDFDDNPTTDAADDVERNALIADMAFAVDAQGGSQAARTQAAPRLHAVRRPQGRRRGGSPHLLSLRSVTRFALSCPDARTRPRARGGRADRYQLRVCLSAQRLAQGLDGRQSSRRLDRGGGLDRHCAHRSALVRNPASGLGLHRVHDHERDVREPDGRGQRAVRDVRGRLRHQRAHRLQPGVSEQLLQVHAARVRHG
jgi:hypothetical protein